MTVDLFIIIADRIARSFPMPSAIQVPPLIQVFPGERNHGCCKKKTKKAKKQKHTVITKKIEW